MFLLTRRQAHAALAGAAAAATWLAAAEIGSKKPVRVGTLFLLSSAALAAVMGQGATNRASVKATITEARLSNFLSNGGSVGGDLHTLGDHYVVGTSHLAKVNLSDTMDVGSHDIKNMQEVYPGGSGGVGFHCPVYMNGHHIYMQGGGGGGTTVNDT